MYDGTASPCSQGSQVIKPPWLCQSLKSTLVSQEGFERLFLGNEVPKVIPPPLPPRRWALFSSC